MSIAKKLAGMVVGTPFEPAARAVQKMLGISFKDSSTYWERRYATGGNSGSGSYGRLAQFKADYLNKFLADNDINTAIEFGCGDGNQLEPIKYKQYLGLDVSDTILELCKKNWSHDPSKTFQNLTHYDGTKADLTLSLDVIYHLVEDAVFHEHMRAVFDASERFVVIFASNFDNSQMADKADHVRHRKFTDWVEANLADDWKQIDHVPSAYPFDPADPDNTTLADFYVFKKTS